MDTTTSTNNTNELIDIYDASLRPLGQKDRYQAHQDGDWHRTFHCWLVRTGPDPALLFQLRSESLPDDPLTWDVSAAGHLSAGEDVIDGAREVREELGIVFQDESLIFAGERVEVRDHENGMKNREYQSVHFLPTTTMLHRFEPQLTEVAGLLWLPLTHGIRLFDKSVHSVACESVVFVGGECRFDETVVRVSDFLPRIQRYYLSSLLCAQRISSGEYPIAI